MSPSRKGPLAHKVSLSNQVELEERRGLLYSPHEDIQHDYQSNTKTESWPTKNIVITALAFITLLIFGTFARTMCVMPERWGHSKATKSSSGLLLSNGTHDLKQTVVIISIDGLRADYLDRGLTPHLLALSKKGLRAKSMKPVFPTLTFPNHWSIMTGLYPESHGIVANNFWDPASQEEFHYNQASAWKPSWWFGEPMWETAKKAGVITANLMWPGPPKTRSGASSTYYVPWKDKVPLSVKLDQIMQWIDLPLETRPQLIMAYEPSLDQAGHATGPYSALVNATLVQVDIFAKNLHDELASRNLTDIVDVIFVSDHGMTDTSHPKLIYMDDILGEDGIKAIAHEDGFPSMGLRFHETANVTKHLTDLMKASSQNPEKFNVYTRTSMPRRYHFANNERIAPIYVVPNIGYILTTRAEGDVGIIKGNHGYDNDEPAMHAVFVAHGPFSTTAKAQHQHSRHTQVERRGWHLVQDDTYIIDTFQNVEIYNLVMKLLGISKTAPNNGTTGFWDQYL